MSTERPDLEALVPRVPFCRVGDALGVCATMVGQSEDAFLYTADQLRTAIQAADKAATERAASRWLPIETAPRDATAILVMQNNWAGCPGGVAQECNGHNTYVAQWWEGERKGAGAWICYMDSVHEPECPVEPTHWMPLPAAPGAVIREAK